MDLPNAWVVLSSVFIFTYVRTEQTLEVSNSGPACLDSELTFTAILHSSMNDSAQQPYLFVWISDVFYPEIRADYVVGSCVANLTKLFTRYEVQRFAQYRMDVKVFNLSDELLQIVQSDPHSVVNITDIVVKATNNFTITERFRIDLDLKQNNHRHKNYRDNIFISGYPIILTANVIDRFIFPQFAFCWTTNGRDFCGNESQVEVVFNSMQQNYLGLYAIVNASVTDRNGTYRSVDRLSHYVRREPVVKDLVTNFSVNGKQTAYIDEEYTVLVGCNGSSPFNISWNLTALFNGSDIDEGRLVDVESCNHSLMFRFSAIGSYILSVSVENPVDIETAELFINVTATAVTTVAPNFRTSPVVPVLSVVVAIVAVAALVWSYVHDRKANRIEIADFEFYSPAKFVRRLQSYGSTGISSSTSFRKQVDSGAETCCETVELNILTPSGNGTCGTVSRCN